MLSFLIITFQRNDFQVLEQDIPLVIKLAEAFKEIHIISKGAEKEFVITGFFKVNALRREKSGPIVRKC